MKLRHLLFGVLAGVAFVACTNDNEPAGVTPANGDEVATSRSYLNVNFVMPGSADTRADAKFEAGTADENKVSNGVLFFFDGTTQVADPYVLGAENGWTAQTAGTDINIEKKSPIIVVLENPLRNPTSVVAVLNATMSDLGLSKSSTLADIKAVLKDFSATDAGKFVMSSSAYKGAINDVAAKIETVHKTEAEAKAAPSVKIPVERVVAKVEVDASNPTMNLANTTTASNKVTIDGKEVTLTATVDGFWLDNTADKSLLLKDISANTDADTEASNMRSYWAKSAATAWAHGTISDATAAAKYVQENTNAQNPTQVVVGVTLKANNAAVKLVKYLGKLYTETGFATEAINVLAHKYFVKDGNNYNTVSDADIEVTYIKTNLPSGVTLKPYEAYANLAKKTASAVFYVKNAAGEYVAAADADVTADLKGYVVQRWDEGKAYYAVKIQHDAERLGVVRNHVYKLTVKSINGLGTPVPFKDVDEIIPEIPEEKETYISAEIDILAWKIVKQDVDLGK